MKLIKELRDLEATGKDIPQPEKQYSQRVAARAIILDPTNNIALISISKFGYHKLPGGGLEEREDIKEALKREAKEEVGCDIEIINEVGEVIEYKNEYNQKQTSYCYLAKTKGPKGKTSFTKDEIGFKLLWVPIKKAMQLMESDSPKDYTAKFIRLRDYTFLSAASKLLK
jgi:8-oxo-dGTP diphosphatase